MNFNFRQNLPYVLCLGIISWVFSNWFLSPVTLGGDFNFVSYDHFKLYSTRPYIWDFSLNNGFGQITLFTLPFFYYSYTFNFLTAKILNAFILHKLIFLFPLLLITLASAYYFSKQFLINRWSRALFLALYLLNPYFLMLTSGGQLGVSFAYGFSPLLFSLYYQTLKKINHTTPSIIKTKWFLMTALASSALLSFDTRMAILLFGMVIVIYVANFLTSCQKKTILIDYLTQAIITMVIAVGIHSYWLLPSILVQSVALPQGYNSIQSVQFFSFTRFAHSLTWTHPNYPDNIFGLVKEVSGISFIIPILAFLSLKKFTKLTLYFSTVALISAFFAKGTNGPWGIIYLYSFSHIPSFSWFRDSTKFFLPLSIAYAYLVSSSSQHLIESSFSKLKKVTISLLCLVALLYVWYPALNHRIGGTLTYRIYPQPFKEIENTLKKDKSYGRVLWIPGREMYGYTDILHPAVSLQDLRSYPYCIPTLCLPKAQQSDSGKKEFSKADLFKQIDQETDLFSDPYTEEIFQALAINYVIISPDIDKSLYLYDRKYDESIRNYYQNKINSVPWLKPLNIDKISAFSTKNKGSLLTSDTGVAANDIDYLMLNPTKYKVNITQSSLPVLFSQRYDEHWILRQEKLILYPVENRIGLMQFPSAGLKKGEAYLEYTGQKFAYLGWTVSIIIALFTLAFVTVIQIKKREVI